jgi:hypothetical protein
MDNFNIGNYVKVDKTGDANNGQYGQIVDNSGNPLRGPFMVHIDNGEVFNYERTDLLIAGIESYDTAVFDLLSTYDRSISGYIYLLLKSKVGGNLYIQLFNYETYDVEGPYLVGPTVNDLSNPNNGTDEEYDLSNTTFSMEDHEKNRRLEKGTIVIIGQTNTPDRDTYRYICTRIGGPWKRQRVIREVG